MELNEYQKEAEVTAVYPSEQNLKDVKLIRKWNEE